MSVKEEEIYLSTSWTIGFPSDTSLVYYSEYGSEELADGAEGHCTQIFTKNHTKLVTRHLLVHD